MWICRNSVSTWSKTPKICDLLTGKCLGEYLQNNKSYLQRCLASSHCYSEISPQSHSAVTHEAEQQWRLGVQKDHISSRAPLSHWKHSFLHLNLKVDGLFSPHGRQFGSFPYLESEASTGHEAQNVRKDIVSSVQVSAPSTWHTKLSAILTTDSVLKNQGAGPVVRQVRTRSAVKFLPKQNWRGREHGPGSYRIPTPYSVCLGLHHQPNIQQSWRYFKWAGRQEGFKHNAQTYNAMVQLFCRAKELQSTFDLLQTMQRLGLSMTSRTCVTIMKGLAGDRMFDTAVKSFESWGAYGFKPDVVAYNSYLDVLVKGGRYDQIEAAFVKMPLGGLVPDIFTYSIIINGYGKAGKTEKALLMYNEMKQKGCSPDVVTYTTLINALGKSGRTDEALEIFCEMCEKGESPSIFPLRFLQLAFCKDQRTGGRVDMVLNSSKQVIQQTSSCGAGAYRTLLYTLFKTRDIDSAMKLLKEVETRGQRTSLAIYNLFLIFLREAGKVDIALKLFKEMKQKGCRPNVLSYITLIETACRAQKAEEACSLHKEMVAKGYVADVKVYNMVIDVVAKAGHVDAAFDVFSRLQTICKPNTHTYNILIFTLCNLRDTSRDLTCMNKAGFTSNAITSREQGAVEVFRAMKKVTTPDSFTYQTLIQALLRAHRVNDVLNILLEMEMQGFDVGVHIYNKVLNILGSSGKIDKAWRLFAHMHSRGSPDLITYTTLIKFLARAGSFGKATKLLEDMERKGVMPNIITYGTLMDGLAKSHRFEEVDKLFKKMTRKGYKPDTYLYGSIINAYCKAGQVAKAYSIFEESIDKGCIPDVHIYNSLIDGYFRSGNVNDALDMYNLMIGMGCKANSGTYTILLKRLASAGRVDEVSQILEDIHPRNHSYSDISLRILEQARGLTANKELSVTV